MAESILVVDDDTTIRQLLRHRFEAAGFEVRVCEDGQEAADLLSTGFEPDALVVDVMMPRLNGTRLVRMLRNGELAIRTDLPVVMLTSRGREEHVLEGFDAGVDDYVSKPFRSAELLARVRRHLP
ncbi:response regulator transcription factor [Halorhabdus sp. BNX81]|uniref:response regulator transcription factor n=1 Tax=Halorhabdus sp. BNX81 TaxID=2980181 RepID=UPI0023DD5DBB|nr:response regulator transcription factor [Halorhabdus sp. BNX81]WEL20136.1 REC domain [Halorhabdus sp. BNX81]